MNCNNPFCHNHTVNERIKEMTTLNLFNHQYIVPARLTGATGATGCTGPTGCTGATGLNGATGPQGERGLQGERGEKGEQGDRGEKGEKGEQGERGIDGLRGATGAQGEKGERGEKGEKGDAGLPPNQNATILSMASQDLVIGKPITMSTILTNNGLILGGDSITVPATGTYIVTFYVNRATSAAGTDGIAIAVDGQINSYTSRPLSEESTSSGYFVMNLDEGNTISLVPVIINAKKINASGGSSATLTVIRIS